jgi:hypothetical protein
MNLWMANHSDVEKPLRREERDARQDPCPGRNNFDFRRQSSVSFFFR